MTVVKQNGAMCEIIGTMDEQPPMNVGKDSLFYMLDTKKMYYFNGTVWYPIGESGDGQSDGNETQKPYTPHYS